MQPLLQNYLGYKIIKKESSSETKSNILSLMSFAFLGMLIWGFIRIWKSKPGQFSTSVGERGHLIWSDQSRPNQTLLGSVPAIAYLAGISLPLLFMKDRKGYMLLAIGVITAIYSLTMAGKQEFGSYWCFSAVAYSIAALFV
jgi:hypothetical protein